MSPFDFYKNIKIDDPKVSNIFLKLNKFYDSIPETKGCMENINKKKGCGGWCCLVQTPQLLYSEFLLIWDHLSKTLSDDEICELFEKCMLNAVDNVPSKGCVFFDKKTKLCKIHKVRPYNCRIYGITPPEEFNPRYEKLKKEYMGVVGAVIKPQCDLVSEVDDVEITVDEINQWWLELNNIEKSIGIPEEMINDKVGGSYRTPHDHILLYNMPDNVLNAIAGIKMYDDCTAKISTIKQLIQVIKDVFKK